MDDVFYEKMVKCLYCLQSFKTKRMKYGKVKIKRVDRDFCTYYDGHNPLFYEVNLCPYCWLAFTDGFNRTISDARREYLKRNYIDKVKHFAIPEYRDVHDAIKYFQLALICASLRGEKNFIQASLCMRLAWLNRYTGNVEVEQRHLRNALEKYNQILQTENLENIPMEEEKMILLVAELYGRLGDYKQARQCYSFFFSKSEIAPKWRKMAKSRWEEYRLEQQIQQKEKE